MAVKSMRTKFMCKVYDQRTTPDELRKMDVQAVARACRMPVEHVIFERDHALKSLR